MVGSPVGAYGRRGPNAFDRSRQRISTSRRSRQFERNWRYRRKRGATTGLHTRLMQIPDGDGPHAVLRHTRRLTHLPRSRIVRCPWIAGGSRSETPSHRPSVHCDGGVGNRALRDRCRGAELSGRRSHSCSLSCSTGFSAHVEAGRICHHFLLFRPTSLERWLEDSSEHSFHSPAGGN